MDFYSLKLSTFGCNIALHSWGGGNGRARKVCIGMAGVAGADPRMGESRKGFVSASVGRMEIFLKV